jgi:class 3 adenylate cyclase
MDDVRAVMDAAGSECAALLGSSEGGPMSILFAATYPERVWALVLWSTFPRWTWAPHYPIGQPLADAEREIAQDLDRWSHPSRMIEFARMIAADTDPETQEVIAANIRQSASPGAVEALHRMNLEIDVTAALPAIDVPTYISIREGDDSVNLRGSRYLAEKIAGARYVERPGRAHSMSSGDWEELADDIEDFLRDAWELSSRRSEPERVLATVLFTDIVGSTQRLAELGDRRWRKVIEDHHARVRRQLLRFGGIEIDTAGDGFFARFDGPARAIRCAHAIADNVGELGLSIRAGLHTGECEVADGKVAGIAVVIGARVAARAGPGEVLVSGTVKDLVAGSDLRFDDRGVHELKGVPGEWRLFAAAP